MWAIIALFRSAFAVRVDFDVFGQFGDVVLALVHRGAVTGKPGNQFRLAA